MVSRSGDSPAPSLWRHLADTLLALATVAAVTTLGQASGLNAAGVGFLFVIATLLVAVTRGLVAGLLVSVAAPLAFNYYFLTPLYTFSIAHSENWVAFGALAATTVVASRLITAAQRRAEEAAARRAEAEMLYELCFGLFTADATPGGLRRAAARALAIVGATRGGILLADGVGTGELHSAGPESSSDGLGERPEVAAALAGRLMLQPLGDGTTDAYVPMRLGRDTTGVFVALGTVAPERVLEPAGRLLALAFERDKALAEAARIEALRQSDALKTALLRAVSHDLRSPLTALAMEVEALRRAGAVSAAGEPHLRALERDAERLARRIDNLLTLARLESGRAAPRPEPTPPGELLRHSRDALAAALGNHPVESRVAAGTPDLFVDPALGLEMVVNLLENAARATPPGTAIELLAGPEPGRAGRVHLEVRDRGPGLPPEVARRYGSASRPEALAAGGGSGLGLEIARSLAEASGGALALEARPGGGTIARVILPAAEADTEAAEANIGPNAGPSPGGTP